jgi:hypothetical protein
MRAEADQVEMIFIRLPVNQDQVRLDVAVPVVGPFTGEWVIEVAVGQGKIGSERVHDAHQDSIESLAVAS